MSNKPLVSVLMNCYNGEKYLRAAIESILSQTYQNWELIFWDNRSDDNSARIFNSYKDCRLKYFLAPKHTGLGEARISAQTLLTGAYVAILDADDISPPLRLEAQVRFLENNPHIALVASWVKKIDEDGNEIALQRPTVNPSSLNECLAWKNPITNSSVMYRTSAAKEVGWYPDDLTYAQDYALLIKLAAKNPIAVLDQFLCIYRELSSGMTKTKSFQRLIVREQIALLELAKSSLKLSRGAMYLNMLSASLAYIKLGKIDLGDGLVLRGGLEIGKGIWKLLVATMTNIFSLPILFLTAASGCITSMRNRH